MDTKALLALDEDEIPRLGARTQALQQKLLVLDYGCWLAELADTQVRSIATKNFVERYPRSPGAILLQQKAAVTVGTTTDATWAGPLVQPMEAAFVKLARSASLLGRIPGLRKIPFNTKVPWQTTRAAYAWVGENGYLPVTNLAFSNGVTLTLTKLGAVPVLTRELQIAAKAGHSAALVEALEADITVATDKAFLDPANVAVATVNPGSVTNPTVAIASTGNYAADVQTLLTAFYTGRPSAQAAVIVTNLAHASAIKAMNGGGGVGLEVLVSEGALGNTIAIDPGGVFLADNGISVEGSTETSLQMNSTPDNPATATTVMVSTWQTNTIAYRVLRYVNWTAQTGAVKYLAG